VTTEHNEWTSHHRVTRALNRATIGLDDHVFAVSEQVRASMSKAIARQTEVLRHGVDVDDLRARRDERVAARRALEVKPDQVVIGTVANLRTNKDYPTLLAAAGRVAAVHPEILFVSVGQGPLAEDVASLRDSLGLGERFRFLGYREDPIEVLAGCDVFCLASRFEGLPIALLEALALGLPAVVTSVGAMPDVVCDGESGLVVPPGDPARLADALIEMLDPERRRRMGETALERSRSFGIRPAVERQQEIYEQLARRRRGG
jgi:glycosyltransferase involved in cell wall biosynthesis